MRSSWCFYLHIIPSLSGRLYIPFQICRGPDRLATPFLLNENGPRHCPKYSSQRAGEFGPAPPRCGQETTFGSCPFISNYYIIPRRKMQSLSRYLIDI